MCIVLAFMRLQRTPALWAGSPGLTRNIQQRARMDERTPATDAERYTLFVIVATSARSPTAEGVLQFGVGGGLLCQYHRRS